MQARKRRSLAQRFSDKTTPEPNSGCLLWIGAENGRGYGHVSTGGREGRMALSHRVAWELRRGPIPPGMYVCHRCDTRCCVNIDHLFLGTHRENMADARAKGRNRWTFGEMRPGRKIRTQDARDIRAIYSAGGVSLESLGRKYGLSGPYVGQVVAMKKWKSA